MAKRQVTGTCFSITYGVVASLIVLGLLIGLATWARNTVTTTGDDVMQAALLMTASTDLDAICINGSKTVVDGAVIRGAPGNDTPRFLLVCSNAETFDRTSIMKHHDKKGDDFFDVWHQLNAFLACGAMVSYYAASDIQHLIRNQPDGNWGAFRTFNATKSSTVPHTSLRM